MDFLELLTKNLEFLDPLKPELKCILCENVLVLAKCGPCGCQYCVKCIEKYLNISPKYCPGDTEDCKSTILSLNENICDSIVTNKKIEKLEIKCPFGKECTFTDQVKRMLDHSRICKYRDIKCPFVLMGCNKSHLNEYNIKDHLLDNLSEHATLEVDIFERLNNEIKFVNEKNKELNSRIEEVVSQNVALSAQVDKMKEEMMRKCENIKELCMNNERIQFLWTIKNVFQRKDKILKARLNNEYSSPFPNNLQTYQFQLGIDFNGLGIRQGTHLFVGFRILKSEFDDALQWPCPKVITLSLVNRATGQDHASFNFSWNKNIEFNYNYLKPIVDDKNILGDDEFISWAELDSNKNLSKNGEIIVRCVISDS